MDKKAYCSKCEQKQHYFVKQEDLARKVKENTYTLNAKVAHCAICYKCQDKSGSYSFGLIFGQKKFPFQ